MTDIRRHLPGILTCIRDQLAAASGDVSALHRDVKEALTDFLPPSYGVATGHLVNAQRQRSRALDVIIYDKTIPVAVRGESEEGYDLRQVLLALLLAPTLEQATLAAALEAVASVKRLRPPPAAFSFRAASPSVRIPKQLFPLGLIGCHSWLGGKGQEQEALCLALDAESTVRAAVARHPRLSLEISQLLAEDAAATVRAALARNVHASKETLVLLARDAHVEVRAALARNPRLPAEVFELLVQDERAEVRQGLASNPSLPFPLLEQLAANASPEVRCCLAANPRTPPGLLEAWLQGEIQPKPQGLPALAQKMLSLRQPQSKPSDKKLLLALARNPHAPSALLAALAEYRSGKFSALTDLYAAVAAHKRTPVETLKRLADRQDRAIWRSLAVNPHTPLDVLKRLLAVEDDELRVRVAHHPAVLRDQRRIVVDLLLEKVRQDKRSSMLPAWFFFQQGELPETRFRQLLASTIWRDRYLVAQHPRASQETLTALTHDGNRFVRAAARTALIRRALFKKRVRPKRQS